MAKQILSIDIQKDSVSAVLLKNSIKGNVIAACTHMPFSDKNSSICLQEAIEDISNQADITETVCVIALPAGTISFRNIHLPFKDSAKIRQVLPFELEPSLPFPVESQVIDFKPVKASKQGSIMTASVESDFLQSYIDNIGVHGLSPKMITIGGYALANLSAEMSDIPPDSILLDINENDTTVFVISSGKIALIRSFPVSADTDAFEKKLSDQVIQSLGILEAQQIHNFIPEAILITGAGISGKQPEHDLEELMSIPVRRIDLLNEIRFPILNELPSDWNPDRLNSVLALAISETESMGGINFRRGRFALRTRWITYKKELIRTGILSGLLLLAGIFYLGIDTWHLKRQTERQNHQIHEIFKSTFPDVSNKVKMPDMQYQMMKAETGTLLQHTSGNRELSENPRVIDIINRISTEVSQDSKVIFSQFVMGAGTVSITGTTDTFNTVNDIKTRIEKIPQFSKVTISSANSDRTDKQVKFKLQIQLGADMAEQEQTS
ncbi:MAG: pilus assembly protein PilM [Desulfobacterales bacterium]|nr:pilus assembly protein PilM [Desulfobacterales bacterium]